MEILEKNSKSASKFEVVNLQTGEILQIKLNQYDKLTLDRDPENFRVTFRNLTYRLQFQARKILLHTRTKNDKNWGVCYCLRARRKFVMKDISRANTEQQTLNPHIRYNVAKGKAYYGGLQRCGGVWVCPICHAKIIYVRRMEMQKGIANAISNGLDCFMITYTIRNNKKTPLKKNLKNFLQTLSKFKGNRRYKHIMSTLGYFGAVRKLDITYTQKNGFHPHSHELIFTDHEISKKDLEIPLNDLRELWIEYCTRHKLGVPKKSIGIVATYIKDKDRIGKYLTKCTISKTDLQQAKGAKQSLSPMDFLELSKDTNDEFAALFREYANATHGLAHIFWSKGLKKKLNLTTFSDKDIVDKNLESTNSVFVFSDELWRNIIHNKADLRNQILQQYECGGALAVYSLLDKHHISYLR